MNIQLKNDIHRDIHEVKRDCISLGQQLNALEYRVKDIGNEPVNLLSHDQPISSSQLNEEDHHLNHTGFPYFNHRQTTRSIQIKPPTYDGSDDFEEYLSQFETIAQINNYDYSAKTFYLPSSVKGSARAILSELNTTQKHEFDTLVK